MQYFSEFFLYQYRSHISSIYSKHQKDLRTHIIVGPFQNRHMINRPQDILIKMNFPRWSRRKIMVENHIIYSLGTMYESGNGVLV